jgi:hypothetical protein
MSLSVQLGLVLALATAFVSILGFLYKHRGAVNAPPVDWRRPVSSTAGLFRNRWWVIGILVAMGGWVFHVAALALAPITLVQSVIAGGLVLLTVISERIFGLTVTRREWIGVALTAAGSPSWPRRSASRGARSTATTGPARSSSSSGPRAGQRAAHARRRPLPGARRDAAGRRRGPAVGRLGRDDQGRRRATWASSGCSCC